MGMFDKLSGLLGGGKGKKSGSAGGSSPARTPVTTPKPAPARPPQASSMQRDALLNGSGSGSSPQARSASSAPTAASAKTSTASGGGAGTATMPRPADRVVIDLSDDAPGTTISTESVRSTPQKASDMLSDVPPPPPAFSQPEPAQQRVTGPASAAMIQAQDDALEPVKAPKNRQELIEELQKNYTEIVSLVRKVDTHLDSQDKRSVRLLEIAETLPGALQELGTIREQHAKLATAIDALTEATKQSSASSEAAQSMQIKTLGEVRSLLESSENHERQVAQTLEEFKGSIGEVALSTGKLGGVLEGIESRQARRETELREAIESGQKWMVTAVVLGLVCLGIVVIVGVIAFA